MLHVVSRLNNVPGFRNCWPKGRVLLASEVKIWTQPRVTEVIRRQFDVSYHPSQVGRILKDCGWSRQKRVRRATQKDEAAIQRWKEERWPQLKKGL